MLGIIETIEITDNEQRLKKLIDMECTENFLNASIAKTKFMNNLPVLKQSGDS